VKIKNPPGATPLEADDLEGLIPNLRTQGELNDFEAANITSGMLWAEKSRKLKSQLLSASGLCLLHKKMFGSTWKWAGQFRMKEVNIGVAPSKIQNQLGILLDDVKYWIEYDTYPIDEIAIRFKHKLVSIHPFRNGNGRHSRAAADLLLYFNGFDKFSWGGERENYIKALKLADKTEDVKLLLKFARA
jgi:Fic-DOC domain mobile mystery protein B